jgi:hypothetical protein
MSYIYDSDEDLPDLSDFSDHESDHEIKYVSDNESDNDDSYVFTADSEYIQCDMEMVRLITHMKSTFASAKEGVQMAHKFIDKCKIYAIDNGLLAEFLQHVWKNKAYHTDKIIDYVRGVCTRGTYCVDQLYMFANAKNKYSQNLRFMVETCADYFTNHLDQLERAIITIQNKFDSNKKTQLKLETYLDILYKLFQDTNGEQFIEFTKRRVVDLNTIKDRHTHHEIWRQACRVRRKLYNDSNFWKYRLSPHARKETCSCELCKSWKLYPEERLPCRLPGGPPPPGSRRRH